MYEIVISGQGVINGVAKIGCLYRKIKTLPLKSFFDFFELNLLIFNDICKYFATPFNIVVVAGS